MGLEGGQCLVGLMGRGGGMDGNFQFHFQGTWVLWANLKGRRRHFLIKHEDSYGGVTVQSIVTKVTEYSDCLQ